MVSPLSFNTTANISHHQKQHHNQHSCISPREYGAYIFPVTAATILICLYGLFGNTLLVLRQRKTLLWFDQRPLYLCVFVANAFSAFVHLIAAPLKIITDEKMIIYQQVIISLADTAVVANMLSITALTFSSLFVIRRHLYHTDRKPIDGKISIIVAAIIWPLACVFSFLGFAPHDENRLAFVPEVVVAICHYGLSMLLHLLTGFAVFKIHRYNNKLQTDFGINRAQQTLELRVLIKRIVKRTSASEPALFLNAALWVITVIADMIIDAVGREDDDDDDQCPMENPVWDVTLDLLHVFYAAICPLILSLKRGRAWKQMVGALRCKCSIENDIDASVGQILTTTSQQKSLPSENSKGENGGHWSAMEKQWSRVERSKKADHNPGLKEGRRGAGVVEDLYSTDSPLAHVTTVNHM